MQQPSKSPSPELIFSLMNAYQQSAVLKGAIDLELFTAIAEGNTNAKTIAERCKASARGVRIMADYLTVTGLLTKNNETYGLSVDSATFLDKRSPAYIGGATQFLLDKELVSAFSDLASTVRKGSTLIPDNGTISVENPVWVDFARGMGPLMFPAAQALPDIAGVTGGGPCKILDIAAGHGLFGIMMAAKNPKAEIVALDWPKVLEVAAENAQKFNVADRWKTLSGDALKVDYGKDYDVVLLTNFLHHFDPAAIDTILKKTRAALKAGGKVVTLEFVPNDDRVSPPVPATFAMVMLASTPAGDAYTFAEFERMFKNAGFSRSELHQLTGHPEQVIISHA